MLQDSAFDLTKLHTVASDLNLGINSANILDISIALHSYHVAGSVKTSVIFTYRIRILHKY